MQNEYCTKCSDGGCNCSDSYAIAKGQGFQCKILGLQCLSMQLCDQPKLEPCKAGAFNDMAWNKDMNRASSRRRDGNPGGVFSADNKKWSCTSGPKTGCTHDQGVSATVTMCKPGDTATYKLHVTMEGYNFGMIGVAKPDWGGECSRATEPASQSEGCTLEEEKVVATDYYCEWNKRNGQMKIEVDCANRKFKIDKSGLDAQCRAGNHGWTKPNEDSGWTRSFADLQGGVVLAMGGQHYWNPGNTFLMNDYEKVCP